MTIIFVRLHYLTYIPCECVTIVCYMDKDKHLLFWGKLFAKISFLWTQQMFYQQTMYMYK